MGFYSIDTNITGGSNHFIAVAGNQMLQHFFFPRGEINKFQGCLVIMKLMMRDCRTCEII